MTCSGEDIAERPKNITRMAQNLYLTLKRCQDVLLERRRMQRMSKVLLSLTISKWSCTDQTAQRHQTFSDTMVLVKQFFNSATRTIKRRVLRVAPARQRGRSKFEFAFFRFALRKETSARALPSLARFVFGGTVLARPAVAVIVEMFHRPFNVEPLCRVYQAADVRARLHAYRRGRLQPVRHH